MNETAWNNKGKVILESRVFVDVSAVEQVVALEQEGVQG
jgi:hypothetical protein